MKSYTKRMSLIMLLLMPLSAFSAEAGSSPGSASSYNFLLISMLGVIVTLMFVIGMAGNVLRKLSIVWKDRDVERKSNDSGSTTVKSIVLLLFGTLAGYATYAQDAAEEAPHVNWDAGSIGGIAVFDFYLMMGIIILEFLVLFALLILIKVLINILNGKPELVPQVKAITKGSFWDRFNKVVPIEKEKDILLDHDYDGIQELDNSLPPWWKYGFYFTILVAFVYIWRFHIGDGPSSHQEYIAEVQQAEAETKAYLAKSANNVDETTVKLLTDESALASGKKLFEATCAACHAGDGGGGVGPNLTDNFWLHGGSIQDVFKSIKYGWQDKGMKSWKDDFSPKQIAEISSFVLKLKGTNPAAPKEPQGQEYIEQSPEGAASDSTENTVVVK